MSHVSENQGESGCLQLLFCGYFCIVEGESDSEVNWWDVWQRRAAPLTSHCPYKSQALLQMKASVDNVRSLCLLSQHLLSQITLLCLTVHPCGTQMYCVKGGSPCKRGPIWGDIWVIFWHQQFNSHGGELEPVSLELPLGQNTRLTCRKCSGGV
jgi:hypothetical protein